MRVCHSYPDLIGHTPLLELRSVEAQYGLEAVLLGKLEYLNPAGSVKDRAAWSMIEDAEKRGLLRPGATIVEETSGNTGIGLAAVAAARGYRAVFTMPDTMSVERRAMLSAYGAEIVLTDGKLGMQGAADKAAELARTIPGAFFAGQFVNPANPAAHEKTTGPEIWEDTDGKAAAFVAGIGTGGTLTGTGRYLKKRNPAVRVIGVEPARSPLLSCGKAGPHGLQGIGANFVPEVFDRTACDELVTVSDGDAFRTGAALARKEGILVGITSGAAVWAAAQVARRPEYRGKIVVALLPDSGDRYLSSEMFRETAEQK